MTHHIPMLMLSSYKGEFTIYSDASKHGIGCVLMEDGETVAYAFG